MGSSRADPLSLKAQLPIRTPQGQGLHTAMGGGRGGGSEQILQAGDPLFGGCQQLIGFAGVIRLAQLAQLQGVQLILQAPQPLLQLQQTQSERFAHLAEGLQLFTEPLLQFAGGDG